MRTEELVRTPCDCTREGSSTRLTLVPAAFHGTGDFFYPSSEFLNRDCTSWRLDNLLIAFLFKLRVESQVIYSHKFMVAGFGF